MLTAIAAGSMASPSTSPGPRSFVASERLGLEPGAVVAIIENMGDPNRGRDPLDPALDEFEVGVVAQAEVVQPLCLGPTDVTGRGIALRVDVCVVLDEGLPVLITRPFDRISNLLPSECHRLRLLFTRLDYAGWCQGYSRSTASPRVGVFVGDRWAPTPSAASDSPCHRSSGHRRSGAGGCP